MGVIKAFGDNCMNVHGMVARDDKNTPWGLNGIYVIELCHSKDISGNFRTRRGISYGHVGALNQSCVNVMRMKLEIVQSPIYC